MLLSMTADAADFELSFDRPIPADDLSPLLAQSHWAADRGHEQLVEMLEATPIKLGVWQSDRLVGFARVLTDGLYRALIDDVIIDESLRGRGLGGRMMTALAGRLSHVEEVFLRCEKELVGYYERCGYQRIAICLDLLDRPGS